MEKKRSIISLSGVSREKERDNHLLALYANAFRAEKIEDVRKYILNCLLNQSPGKGELIKQASSLGAASSAPLV
jgi:hypothetical protein